MSQLQVPLALLAEDSANLGTQIITKTKSDLQKRMLSGS